MIYLDNNSTTRVDPRVVEVMVPFFSSQYGNAASSTHEMGRQARQAVENARSLIAESIHSQPDEIYFTSGATESNNLAIRGLALHRSAKNRRLVSSSIEHRAVIDPLKRLEKEGFAIDWIPPDANGDLDLNLLKQAINQPVDLVSLMLANNEIGNLLDVQGVAEACENSGTKLHCDAAQAFGKYSLDVQTTPIAMLSLSAHKLYGPKGVGALFVRRGTRLKALLDGGGHEGGKRSGTLNVPGIVGFGEAVRLSTEKKEQEHSRIRNMMNLFDSLFRDCVEGVELNGPSLDQRLLGNLNYRIEGIDAETMTLSLTDVCISTGSACTSAEPEPSHVLKAIGLDESQARSSIRVGIGKFNTTSEIESAVNQLANVIKELRSKQ